MWTCKYTSQVPHQSFRVQTAALLTPVFATPPLPPGKPNINWQIFHFRDNNNYPLSKFRYSTCVQLKFSGGDRGGDTFKPPSPPTNNFCLYPPPVFRCLCKDPLMTPPPPHFKHPSLLPPPHPPPLPPKKFLSYTICA